MAQHQGFSHAKPAGTHRDRGWRNVGGFSSHGLLAYGAPLWGGTPVVSLTQITPRVLAALLALGLVNTFSAYLIFYSLIATLGAARTSMVTYVLPVVGLFFGALFLAEPIDGRLLLGAMLIMGSIGISNLKLTALVTLLQARRSSAL